MGPVEMCEESELSELRVVNRFVGLHGPVEMCEESELSELRIFNRFVGLRGPVEMCEESELSELRRLLHGLLIGAPDLKGIP